MQAGGGVIPCMTSGRLLELTSRSTIVDTGQPSLVLTVVGERYREIHPAMVHGPKLIYASE